MLTSVRIKLTLSVKAVEYACAYQSGYHVLIPPKVIVRTVLLLVVALKTASTSIDSQASEFIKESPVSTLMNVILLEVGYFSYV